ncbi:MAG: YfcE family phosphodiesterase [Patescibacteria group bacterium]|nr:YfcE family phosphodiesterase [Patescibacteria group bacterium]
MKIAIISDIHDNFHNLVLVLKEIKKREDLERIIFLGDFINNGIVKFLAGFYLPVDAIWGNNDGDKSAITKTSLSPQSNLKIADNVYDFLELDGRKIFITHYPDLAKPMAKSGEFDAVFYGHNHNKNKDFVDNCLVVNPGEISGHKTNKISFAIYDTKANDADIIEIDGGIMVKTEEVEDYLKNLDFEFSKSKGHQY